MTANYANPAWLGFRARGERGEQRAERQEGELQEILTALEDRPAT